MSNNPINLTIRFILECIVLIELGYFGWTQFDGFLQWILMVGLPIIAASIWGVLRVNGDPKKAPIAVTGIVRLLIEVLYFVAGTAALYFSGRENPAMIFGLLVILHYGISFDRVLLLLKNKKSL